MCVDLIEITGFVYNYERNTSLKDIVMPEQVWFTIFNKTGCDISNNITKPVDNKCNLLKYLWLYAVQ